MDGLSVPVYDGVWCNYILHSEVAGILDSVEIDKRFKEKHVRSISLTKKPGDEIEVFMGANQSLGTLFLRFDTREELDNALVNIKKHINIKIS